MKLNLGAGNLIMPDYINHDLVKHRKEIDICFDLNNKDWYRNIEIRYTNEVVTEIRAWDVIEHLDDPIKFMDNCWRLLKPGGLLFLKACGWKNPNFYVDITHKKAYDLHSFDYFDPDTDIGKEYGYYTDNKWQIMQLNLDRRNNVICNLTPRK